MDLRPPRLLAGTMAAAALLCFGFAAWAATAGFVGILVAVGLGAIGAGAAALAVIMARHITVEAGRVRVRGPRGAAFDLDALRGPLEVGLFGVRLDDGRQARLVLAQLPALSTRLVAELPRRAPHLRPPRTYPVVVRGRVSTPVAYGVVAAIGVAMGAVGLATGSGAFQRILAGVFLFVGAAALYWVLRRVERRVEITADHVIRRHLVGATRVRRGALAAAHVVTRPRRLPRSTLERDVHLLRLVEDDGRTIDVAPAIAAFPDYGSAGERELARDRAFTLARLAGRSTTWAEIHEGGGVELALWHHEERSAGALPTAVVFRRPVVGRHVVGALEGDVAVGDHPPRVLLRHGAHTLVVIDTVDDAVRRHVIDSPIRTLDPGFGRIAVWRDGAAQWLALDALGPGTKGWPRGGPVLAGTPPMPWVDALERVLAAGPFDDHAIWTLLAARCWPELRRQARRPDVDADAGWRGALEELIASLDAEDR